MLLDSEEVDQCSFASLFLVIYLLHGLLNLIPVCEVVFQLCCVEREGFVKVSRYGVGNGRSRFGFGVGGKRCQLCYFVVFSPRLRDEHGGAIMAQALVVTKLVYEHGVWDVYIGIEGVYIRV